MVVGALLSVPFVATGGCQDRQVPLSKAAEVLYDSLVTANESMYALADPNLGYHRVDSLYLRATSRLDRRLARELLGAAQRAASSRHSEAKRAKVNRGLQGDHPGATREYCLGIDSLWYARYIGQPSAPRKP